MEFASSNTEAAAEDLVLCIDVSPSMGDTDYKPSRIGGAQKAARALVELKCQRAPDDRVGLVTFHATGKQVLGLTSLASGPASVFEAIERAKIGMWTNLSAGLSQSKRLLDESGTLAVPESVKTVWKRFRSFVFDSDDGSTHAGGAERSQRILVLTDGHDNHGRRNPEAVAKRLREASVEIDVVGIGGQSSDVDEKLLKKVASRRADGSPRYWFIRDTANLIRKFEELATSIKKYEEEAA